MKKRILLFALFLLSSFSCKANVIVPPTNGSELLFICSDTNDKINSIYCMSYIDGIVSGWKNLKDFYDPTIIGYCLPNHITNVDELVIVKWLRDHAELLHFPAGYLVIKAILDEYPC